MLVDAVTQEWLLAEVVRLPRLAARRKGRHIGIPVRINHQCAAFVRKHESGRERPSVKKKTIFRLFGGRYAHVSVCVLLRSNSVQNSNLSSQELTHLSPPYGTHDENADAGHCRVTFFSIQQLRVTPPARKSDLSTQQFRSNRCRCCNSVTSRRHRSVAQLSTPKPTTRSARRFTQTVGLPLSHAGFTTPGPTARTSGKAAAIGSFFYASPG